MKNELPEIKSSRKIGTIPSIETAHDNPLWSLENNNRRFPKRTDGSPTPFEVAHIHPTLPKSNQQESQ